MSVPISIKYHAGGIRVEDASGVVGLAWALNAGGSISRTVKGLPDDGGNGFLTATMPNPLVPTTTQLGANLNFYDAAAGGWMDVEPDVFSFNFGGYSGKFVFDATPAHNIKLIPYQNIKIIPSSNYSVWTVTTPDGTIYTFGTAIDNTVAQYTDNSSTFSSAWHLSSIQTPNSDDIITFTYEIYGSSSSQRNFSRDFRPTGSNNYCPTSAGSTSPTSISVNAYSVKTITSLKGRAVFTYENVSDINISKRLASIKYYGNDYFLFADF